MRPTPSFAAPTRPCTGCVWRRRARPSSEEAGARAGFHCPGVLVCLLWPRAALRSGAGQTPECSRPRTLYRHSQHSRRGRCLLGQSAPSASALSGWGVLRGGRLGQLVDHVPLTITNKCLSSVGGISKITNS